MHFGEPGRPASVADVVRQHGFFVSLAGVFDTVR
jgi:hypothetical protein